MRPSIHRLRSFQRAATVALLAVLSTVAACKRAQPGVDPAAPRYTVRGEVVDVQDAAQGRVLVVRHEAIPDFADVTGARTGMRSMTMPFPVGAAARTTQVQKGDRIRFRFAMDWKANAMEIEAIERLPAGTALELGK